MLREEHALAEELSAERAHLAAELEFQRIGRREREEIFWARIQQSAFSMSLCYLLLISFPHVLKPELADSDTEDFRSYISTLTAENSELKAKLKEVESQAQLSENKCGSPAKFKKSEARFKTMEQEYLTAIKNKNIEAKQATQAAQKLQRDGKAVETDKSKEDLPEASQKSKKGINETKRKSKSEGPVSKEKSRTSQVTPDRIEVKTSRTRASETSQGSS
ncbi:hypothetical protein BAE44_0007828 [Dichanthelium oligosanthes]|uniref:Uncharacterized protein n=1 Tax=Dichanthelium oligosanthes TaxID=888268 RepID=A0A1E5W191_9POAL|nr:hypothetical protein BAE44_0007828 [Dichanthelium oligosanthes]